jgi:hypothetical protein
MVMEDPRVVIFHTNSVVDSHVEFPNKKFYIRILPILTHRTRHVFRRTLQNGNNEDQFGLAASTTLADLIVCGAVSIGLNRC